MKPVGQRIREARQERDWTQQRLADELGGDRIMVNKWENGKNRPGFRYRKKLAKVLGGSPDDWAERDYVLEELERQAARIEKKILKRRAQKAVA